MTEAFLFQFPHLNKVRQEAPERSRVFQFPHLIQFFLYPVGLISMNDPGGVVKHNLPPIIPRNLHQTAEMLMGLLP